ncbi:polysaccharide biosynthesis protein, partial [Klebsiella pneumoniae]|uniref:polysaccharide biosynthesis protein n=1 Tax=Klebsiella pneumoniae TaxID=573 RepID=UPI0034E016C5
MIRLAGFKSTEMPIVFSGLRPGEKLYEDLISRSDRAIPTRIPRLLIAQLQDVGAAPDLIDALARVSEGTYANDGVVRETLRKLV